MLKGNTLHFVFSTMIALLLFFFSFSASFAVHDKADGNQTMNNNQTENPLGNLTGNNTDLKVDSDGDSLTDDYEVRIKTDPGSPDTDHDGLSDGKEVLGWTWFLIEQAGCVRIDGNNSCPLYKTGPLLPDTDSDGNSDYYEYYNYPSNPIQSDQDNDSLLDGVETGPNSIHGTSYFLYDSDSDGYSDWQEVNAGTSPLDMANFPNAPDRAPSADSKEVHTNKNEKVEVILSGKDPENKQILFIISKYPLHGTLGEILFDSKSSAKVDYYPRPDYVGDDEFYVWAYDGVFYSAGPARIHIMISAPN